MQLAVGELGQSENNPYSRVHLYFEKCGLQPDTKNIPWCRYFVNWCLLEAGWSVTKDGMARGLLNWGDPVHGEIKVGDIVILWRGAKNDGVTGHVGFFVKSEGQYVYLVGGNQGDKVSEAKFLKSKILDIRRPRSMLKSKTNIAGGTVGTIGAAEVAKEVMTSSGTLDKAVETKTLFEQVINYFPNYKLMLGAAILILGLYIIYNRNKDNKEKGV
jgi:uncharacterized protein (TIGR02594 family)